MKEKSWNAIALLFRHIIVLLHQYFNIMLRTVMYTKIPIVHSLRENVNAENIVYLEPVVSHRLKGVKMQIWW